MSTLQGVRIIGGIAPASLLTKVLAGDLAPASISPASFHLAGNESLRDAAARSWTYLRAAWSAWAEGDSIPTTGQTRERWLLPLLRELGYGNVLALPQSLVIGTTSFPISHMRDDVPIHLLGPDVQLDHRNPGVAGAARAPQMMVQEFLNRSDDHLWAIVSNGSQLRLLRDSTALAGSAYLEFDLDTIFEGELYNEFLLLFQLANSSRLEKLGGADGGPAECWLERWRTDAVDSGTRALEKLRIGVEDAIVAFGQGFLSHPRNGWLVEALRSGALSDREYQRALLRLIYRLLFCFVAEDRGALLDPSAGPEAKARYGEYFSTARLRRMSRIRSGGPHPDLWRAQRLVLSALGGEGLPQIAIPALGGLFDPDPRAPHVNDQPGPDLLLSAELSNVQMLTAVRALAWVEVQGGRTQLVDYRHLGAEELGGVYESLLELIPRVDLAAMTFRLESAAGNDRKTTGSYYTPPALVSALLDSALDPLLDDAVKNADDPTDAERRLLALRVCDPASGSGGFLVAAARRIARRLAEVRADGDEPTPDHTHRAMRDVIGRCIYGVDYNDLAAELAKVSLWLEAMEAGKPLGFLDARIRVGNSLIGTTPALLAEGIPNDAFNPIEGDDRALARSFKAQNRSERGQQLSLLARDSTVTVEALAEGRADLLIQAEDIDDARLQASEWDAYQHSDSVRRAKLHADAWAASFVWPLQAGSPPPVTQAVLEAISADPDDPDLTDTVGEVQRLATEYRFFHWHLEFPEIFDDPGSSESGPEGWAGGFSSMLGNPPWERVKLQEQEFFAARSPEIARAPNAAARTRLIKALAESDPVLHDAFLAERRRAEGASHFLRVSGRYPFNGRGDVNTYAVFAELFRSLTGPHGRSGVIVPTGIATDATTQYFFKDLVTQESLAALYDFENRAGIFPDVDSRMKFCLLTMAGRAEHEAAASFAFFLLDPADIDTSRFALTPEEITLLNPNTGTCPVFRTRRDAEITLGIYRRVPVLINEAKVAAGDPDGNPWGVSFMTMFHMSNDSHLFRTREQLEAEGWTLVGNVFERYIDTRTDQVEPAHHSDPTAIVSGQPEQLRGERMLPLYQGIMFGPYDHRICDVVRSPSAQKRQNQPAYLPALEKLDAARVAMPIYWVPEEEVQDRVRPDRPRWLSGVRKVTSATNERTAVVGSFPFAGLGDSANLLLAERRLHQVSATLASFVLDFALRQKLGGVNLNFFVIAQLPVPGPSGLQGDRTWTPGTSLVDWFDRRILELTYTAWDMSPFAEDLGDVDSARQVSPPFIWDDERRAWLRAELDAAFFHLYGIDRDDVDYIMDTFPIVRRHDEAAHGSYRTKERILQVYDALAQAASAATEYQSVLDPPPGQGPRHGPRS